MTELMQLLGMPIKVHLSLVQPIGLPVLYGMLFRLSDVEIAGQRCMMVYDTGAMRLTPAAIRKHTEVLCAHFEMPVVYVGGEGVPHLGHRLLQHGVAHIIPGKRVFLPFLGMLQQEKLSGRIYRAILGAGAQLAVLAFLYHRVNAECTVEELMAVLKCSRSQVVKIYQELEYHGLGLKEKSAIGKRMLFHFAAQGQRLWEMARPLMQNPCIREVGVETVPPGALPAGIDALAKCSELAEKSVSTFAMSRRAYDKEVSPAYPLHIASYRLQLWSYAPDALGSPDSLSLFLTLENHPDVRVQSALQQLIQDFAW